MILAISLIGANVVLEAWPLWVVMRAAIGSHPLPPGQLAGVVASFGAVVLLNVSVFALAARKGIRALEAASR
ncbi:hypothetical protein D3C83_224720 [compost metagenome]